MQPNKPQRVCHVQYMSSLEIMIMVINPVQTLNHDLSDVLQLHKLSSQIGLWTGCDS